MPIYLDNQTRPVLKRLLEKRMKESPKDFVSERILRAVEADERRLESITNCEHEVGEFTGHKTCCVKCGAYFEPGMGFSWSRA